MISRKTTLILTIALASSSAGCGMDVNESAGENVPVEAGSDEMASNESALIQASFTASASSPLTAETPVTFDASASTCDYPPCHVRWYWSWYNRSSLTYQLGGQMGTGTSVTYAFPELAATKDFVRVVARVCNSEPRIPRCSSAVQAFTVLPRP